MQAGNAGDFVCIGGSKVTLSDPQPGRGPLQKREASSEMPIGEWNSADITSENGTITIYINGVFQNKGTAETHKSGRIALQSEGKDIQFRNVRVTPL